MADKQYLVRMAVVERDAEGNTRPVTNIKPIELSGTMVETVLQASPRALSALMNDGAQRLARGLRRKLAT